MWKVFEVLKRYKHQFHVHAKRKGKVATAPSRETQMSFIAIEVNCFIYRDVDLRPYHSALISTITRSLLKTLLTDSLNSI